MFFFANNKRANPFREIILTLFLLFLDVCIDREIEIAGKATDVHIKDTAGCVSSLLDSTVSLLSVNLDKQSLTD